MAARLGAASSAPTPGIRELLQDLWVVRVPLGLVVHQEQAQSAGRAPLVAEARTAVHEADVVNLDATDGWLEQQRAWLWTVVTTTLTAFRIDQRRGGADVGPPREADFVEVVGSTAGRRTARARRSSGCYVGRALDGTSRAF